MTGHPAPSLRNVGLAMRDGCTLAADVYLPDGPGPWPTVVMLTPYSKDAYHGIIDANYLAYYARNGYAAAIVDFRGTGSSEGVKPDAFQSVESSDVYDSIEQLAAQDWCDGNVGIWGVSYSGIAALRAAAAHPPHLRAVVAVEGSTDPYEYEVMRSGATGLAMIVGEWSGMMMCFNSLPAFAGTPGDNAAEVWAAHLDALTPWHFAWRDHPVRDHYWQGRDVDPASVDVPTMIITGWRDTNTLGAWRDFTSLKGPRRLIAGPWQHGQPDRDSNRPIHSINEMIQWFDRWMRSGPATTTDPQPVNLYVLGRDEWESYRDWPVATTTRTLYLTGDSRLSDSPPAHRHDVPVVFDATVGIHGGLGTSHVPQDQSGDDERSTLFSSEVLGEPLEIIGQIEAELELTGVHPDADVAVRVVDVGPDGSSTLVAKGFLRLSNLAPDYVGETVTQSATTVRVACNPTRYHVAAGHRIRLAVAAADFPEIWPPARAADYAITVGGEQTRSSRVTIPQPAEPPAGTPVFGPPDASLVRQPAAPSRSSLTISSPDASGAASVAATAGLSLTTFDGDRVDLTVNHRASTFVRHPDRTQLTTDSRLTIQQPHRTVTIDACSYSSHDMASATVDIAIDGRTIHHKHFRHTPSTARPQP
ncbi:CocE/NonD family hydrolase [Dactylosporangium sp. CA-233914]|uniref:CocE/NonD family hydrolase n=1 Tax=Dactylosporangium sp. CA-233914 TaxID=3239934 RepID=UPI003D8C090D